MSRPLALGLPDLRWLTPGAPCLADLRAAGTEAMAVAVDLGEIEGRKVPAIVLRTVEPMEQRLRPLN